jgi:hypothetical protein
MYDRDRDIVDKDGLGVVKQTRLLQGYCYVRWVNLSNN